MVRFFCFGSIVSYLLNHQVIREVGNLANNINAKESSSSPMILRKLELDKVRSMKWPYTVSLYDCNVLISFFNM